MVASLPLGELGVEQSDPVTVAWRWYYNVPALPLGILLLLLAVLPRRNRNWRAWTILLLPIVVATCVLLLQIPLADSSELDSVGHFLITLSAAWAGVWLVGHWLAGRSRLRSACLTLGVMLAIGLVSYVSYCGVWASSELVWGLLGFWAACSVPLVAAAALTGICCRGNTTLPKQLLWPMAWIPVACVVSVTALMTAFALANMADGVLGMGMLLTMLLQGVFVAPFLAILLYLLHLPVAVVCGVTSTYQERFHSLFCQNAPPPPASSEVTGASPFTTATSEETAESLKSEL